MGAKSFRIEPSSITGKMALFADWPKYKNYIVNYQYITQATTQRHQTIDRLPSQQYN